MKKYKIYKTVYQISKFQFCVYSNAVLFRKTDVFKINELKPLKILFSIDMTII